MKVKVLFSPKDIIAELIDLPPFTGRVAKIRWDAFSDMSCEEPGLVTWGKPYQDEIIDRETKEMILFCTAYEIHYSGYSCYRGESIGDKTTLKIQNVMALGRHKGFVYSK
jgi:hypothetical protein